MYELRGPEENGGDAGVSVTAHAWTMSIARLFISFHLKQRLLTDTWRRHDIQPYPTIGRLSEKIDDCERSLFALPNLWVKTSAGNEKF